MVNYKINTEYIKNPPAKVLLMYQAVSELLRENVTLDKLKVQDITGRAGIGKGTAYEYFSSKEEIMAHALMYEYSCKIQELVDSVMAVADFHGRIYRVMDWIYDNRDYNEMFRRLMQAVMMSAGAQSAADAGSAVTSSEQEAASTQSAASGCDGEFPREAMGYISHIVEQIMDDGYAEHVFTETNKQKRAMAVLTAMCEYGTIIMSPYGKRGLGMPDGELREFIYSSIVKTLN